MNSNRYFPEKVGRYQYRDLIGIGGFAAVVRCHDEVLDSIVTIKVLLQRWAVNEDIRSRFLQEARLLRRVRSEFVITIHDIGELDDGRPYFVMEYADKGSLQSRLDSYSPEDFNDNNSIKHLIDSLASGLDALHQAGIVHRDIKPDNILLQSRTGDLKASRNETRIQKDLIDEDEKVLIGDLGLAKDSEHITENPNITIIGGSAGYQAPEQTKANGEISAATDIFAATALFWRLFSNTSPPNHDSISIVLKNVDAPWREIFETGMALDPVERYSSISQWQQAINSALSETSDRGLIIPPEGFSNSIVIPCPYKGLASYQPEDAAFFCGRESLVDLLIKRLNRQRILIVGGPSGSGKSSLVRAGLIPAIIKGTLPNSDKWRVLLFTPGVDPIGELHYQLSKGSKTPEVSLEKLRQSPNLARHLGENQPPALLCIDQFEEVFTLCQNKEDQQVFIDALAAFLDPADSQAHLVIAVRADFYTNCAIYPWLTEKISDNQVLVGPMARNELRSAIEKPAKQAGLALEKGLVEAILDETTDDAGSLPLVAHALVETWSRRRHNTLTIEGFRASGGVAGAISQSADTIYNHELNKNQQSAMRRLLLQLVTLGEGAADTSRRLTLTSLYLDNETELMHQLVDNLTKARLLTVDDNSVEVAHEALIRTWPRFRTWIEEGRESLQHRIKIDRSAREWVNTNKDHDLLYRGTPLTLAMEWEHENGNTLSAVGREFLTQSFQTQQAKSNKTAQIKARANKIRRWAISALATLTVVTLLASIFAFSALRTSQENEKRAELASTESNERFVRALAASSANMVQTDPYAALILAAESNVRSHSPSIEARSLLVDSRVSLSTAIVVPYGSPISVDDALSTTISPSGTLIATGARDGNIQLWDNKTGKLLNNLQHHQAGVQIMVFSPDNQLLATGDLGGQALLWDVSQADQQRLPIKLVTLEGEIWGLSFTRDGKRIAIASEDGTARIIDVQTLKPIGKPLIKIIGGLNAITFSPDDSIVVAGGGGGIIRAWDAVSGKPIWENLLPSLAAVRELNFSEDQQILVSCSDSSVDLINPKNGHINSSKIYVETNDHTLLSIRGCLFTNESNQLISGANDGKVHVWDIDAQKVSFDTKLGHKSGIEALSISRDKKLLVSLGQDHKLRRWRYKPYNPLTKVLGKHKGGINAFALYSAGKRVATIGKQGSIHIWSTDGGLVRTLKHSNKSLQAITVSANGQMLAAGDTEGNIQLWHLDKKSPPIILNGHKGAIYSISFNPDNSMLASGGSDGHLRFWSTADAKEIGKPLGPHLGGITRIAFSPDGKEVAVASMSGQVRFWNTENQSNISDLQADDNTIWSISYDKDGERIATSSDDEIVVIRLRKNLEKLGTLSGLDSGATDAQFSPDGRTLATSTRDGKIRLWDMASMMQIGEPLDLHKKEIWQLAWMPDSQKFISASAEGDIRLWNILSIPMACTLGREAFDTTKISRYLGEDAKLRACP